MYESYTIILRYGGWITTDRGAGIGYNCEAQLDNYIDSLRTCWICLNICVWPGLATTYSLFPISQAVVSERHLLLASIFT